MTLCRYVLAVLSVGVIIGIIIGLIFVVHYNFHIWGGQGFLKARKLVLDLHGDEKPQSCLPTRFMARPTNGIYGFDYSILESKGHRRYPPSTLVEISKIAVKHTIGR
jgi:hypothetical protein